MDVADDLILRAAAGEPVPLNDQVMLVSAERLDELEGRLALARFESDRAAGRRQRGISHDEARQLLGL